MTPNKTVLLTRINTLKKELDELVEFVLALEDAQPVQSTPIPKPEPDLWLTPKQVCERLNIAYSTFFDWVRQGKLPPGLQLSPKAKRWRMADITAWQGEKRNSPAMNIIVNESPKRRGRPQKIRNRGELCNA